jgi:hypothetical protein
MTTRDICADIETLSTGATAAIVSIGAAIFDRDGFAILDTFYGVVQGDSARQYGTTDEATLKWWTQQSREALFVFEDPRAGTLPGVLLNLANWARAGLEEDDTVLLWGYGPGFDNALLRHAYVSVGLAAPWRFRGDRDLRTMLDLYPEAGRETAHVGIDHNALDDALYQTAVLQRAFYIHRSRK